ncbi:GD10599 [Drosophila simulans]|uniref:GD10599 n=1 Tax=Drosophila simulans TaxID=7240 RepID=B4QG87_DROSI|nr:GD10599 [Drosophila simulans]
MNQCPNESLIPSEIPSLDMECPGRRVKLSADEPEEVEEQPQASGNFWPRYRPLKARRQKTPQLLISEHSHPLQEEWSAPDPPADDELLADREVEHGGAEGTECECQKLSAASGGRWSTKSCRSEP